MNLHSLKAMTLAASVIGFACLGALQLDFAPAGDQRFADWRPDKPAVTEDLPAVTADYSAILARPVFSALRKPPRARPPDTPPEGPPPEGPPVMVEPAEITPPLEPPQLVLKGVLLENGRKAALLQSPASPDGMWVEMGKEVNGWTLTQVDRDRVELQAGDAKAAFALYVDKISN
ncbi:hypothetical protein BH10PSE7_BH10PSE7_29590 [soil metagenome]